MKEQFLILLAHRITSRANDSVSSVTGLDSTEIEIDINLKDNSWENKKNKKKE